MMRPVVLFVQNLTASEALLSGQPAGSGVWGLSLGVRRVRCLQATVPGWAGSCDSPA